MDVGCFDGAFLQFVTDATDCLNLFGIEVNATAATIARSKGIDIVGTDAENVDESGAYDVIVAFDVIEHLSDPASFLRSLTGLLLPDGILIISTGNVDARSWKLMGARYWYCTLAEHLSFISPSWCRQTAGPMGLSIEHIQLFSHADKRGLLVRVAETAKNLLYRFLPGLFRELRRHGMGGVDISSNVALVDTPPIWITSEDQFLVVFKKTG